MYHGLAPLWHTNLHRQSFIEQIWPQRLVQGKGTFIWSIAKQCFDLFRALDGKGRRGQSQWGVLLTEQNLDQLLKGPFLRNPTLRWRWFEHCKTVLWTWISNILTYNPLSVRSPLEPFLVPCDSVFPRTPCWISKLLRVKPSAAGGTQKDHDDVWELMGGCGIWHSNNKNKVEGLRHHDLLQKMLN